MGLMAGYGVQLWPILQDIHQLRATYGHRAGTFLSNAGVLQFFGVNDHDSARLISDLLGQETVVFQTMARALDSDKTGIFYNQQHTGRPLLTLMRCAICLRADNCYSWPGDDQYLLKSLSTLPGRNSGRCSIQLDASATKKPPGICIGPCMHGLGLSSAQREAGR